VSFATVEEAMQFVDSAEEIILDDHVLSINYALRGVYCVAMHWVNCIQGIGFDIEWKCNPP